MNLGQKRKSPEVASSPESGESKETFPGFSLNDKVADDFLKEYDCDLGDEITATVKLKVSSLRKDEFGNSVGFEMSALDDVKVVGGEDGKEAGEDESGDEKVLGYKPKEKVKAPGAVKADALDDSPTPPKAGTDSSGADSSSEVRSPTKTSTETSTEAYTARNVTVTGGAGAGANTTVTIQSPPEEGGEDDEETKALGYKRPKKPAPPDTSEADISED